MNKHKISNVILRCFILFGGMSILSQTMAMQQDPEVRMNTVISQHNARLAQRDNINRDLTFENEFFQAHQIFGQNCGGQSLVCQDTQQPGQCFVQQHTARHQNLSNKLQTTRNLIP